MRDRAQQRVSWATRGIPSKLLAEHYGVSESRARHLRTDDQSGELTTLCTLIADPRTPHDKAAHLVQVVLESWEERFVFADTHDLRARLRHLLEVAEHRAEMEQNMALMVDEVPNGPACRAHAALLNEIAMIDGLLGGVR